MCLLLALCVAVSYFNAEAVFLKASAHSPDGSVRLRLLAVGRDAAGSGSVPAAAPGAQGLPAGYCAPCSRPCWGQPAASAAGKACGGCVPVCPVGGGAGPYRRRRAVRRPGRAGQDVHKRDVYAILGRHRPAGVHFSLCCAPPRPRWRKRPAQRAALRAQEAEASRRAPAEGASAAVRRKAGPGGAARRLTSPWMVSMEAHSGEFSPCIVRRSPSSAAAGRLPRTRCSSRPRMRLSKRPAAPPRLKQLRLRLNGMTRNRLSPLRLSQWPNP